MAKSDEKKQEETKAPAQPPKSKRFTITPKEGGGVIETDSPLRAKHFKDLGHSVIDGLSGKEYDETNPTAVKKA